jgi:hypothetical protein
VYHSERSVNAASLVGKKERGGAIRVTKKVVLKRGDEE